MKKLLLVLALLTALVPPAWAEPHQVFLLVPPEDQALLRAEASEWGAVNDFLLLGEWQGAALVHCLVDDDHLVACAAWAATKLPQAVYWRAWGQLPEEIRAALRDPESGLTPRDWAGWPRWEESQ